MPKKRSIWYHLHFWIGWISAVPIALVCFTGAVLVFEEEIFRWEHPELYNAEVTGTPLSVDEALQWFWRGDPPMVVSHLEIPQSPTHMYEVFFAEQRPDGFRPGHAHLNPYTGELLRVGDEFSIAETFVALHRNLTVGPKGRQIVAISALLLSLMCFIGLILWWPLRAGTFSRATGRGQALDWHNALGLVSLLPLIVMAVTGVTMTWGIQVYSLLAGSQSQVSQVASPPSASPRGSAGLVPIEQILAGLPDLPPEARLTAIQPANESPRPHRLFFSGDLQIFVDPYTGAEVRRQIGTEGSGVLGWYVAHYGQLHTFAPYNLLLRTLWGGLSLAGAILVVTGLWVSAKRWLRRGRRTASTSGARA